MADCRELGPEDACGDVLERLRIRPVINAAGNHTRLGGSVPSERVVSAMAQAYRHFVPLDEMQTVVHARLAEITNNESAWATCGAAAGLYLAAAAAVSHCRRRPVHDFAADRRELPQLVVHVGTDSPYNWPVRQLPVQFVQVGFPNNFLDDQLGELERALNERTAAIIHAPAAWNAPGTPSLAKVTAMAVKHDIPLIVDAAAQLPPKQNLWEITAAGASVAVFSGGKGLGGPQTSGLVVGSGPLMEWIRRLAFPNYGFGRMLKAGRAELAGLLVAVEQFLQRDEEVYLRSCEAQVEYMISALTDDARISVSRGFPNIAGQPVPYMRVRSSSAHLSCQDIATRLACGNPRVVVGMLPYASSFDDGFMVNTLALGEGEAELVVNAIKKTLDGR